MSFYSAWYNPLLLALALAAALYLAVRLYIVQKKQSSPNIIDVLIVIDVIILLALIFILNATMSDKENLTSFSFGELAEQQKAALARDAAAGGMDVYTSKYTSYTHDVNVPVYEADSLEAHPDGVGPARADRQHLLV
jgi:hypothetical protein